MAGFWVAGAGIGVGIAVAIAVAAAFDTVAGPLAAGIAVAAGFWLSGRSGKKGSLGGDAANGEIDPIYPPDTPDDGSGKP